MNQRTPTMRKHATGQWFARWGGKNHYFGTDRTGARKRYLDSLTSWAAWRAARDANRLPPLKASALTVADLVERFLDAKQLQGGIDLRRYYAKHLKRFNHGFGDAPAEMVRPTHLQTVKDEMLGAGYAPKTVNHDVIAVRSMFDWASGLELISAVNMKGVKVLSLGPPPDKSMPIERVLSMIAKATHPLKAWLALNYLALMRPSEVVRVAHKQGTWVETGVFRLDKGKTDLKATLPRHVCFSDEALSWIDACDPKWSRLDCYSAAVRRVCGPGGPHPLRHSAATHLSQLGEERAAIDLLLGHAPPRVSLTYARINWQPLRQTAARLTLQSVAE